MLPFEETKDELKQLRADLKGEKEFDAELAASYVARLSKIVEALCEELEGLEERVDVLTQAEESKPAKRGLFR